VRVISSCSFSFALVSLLQAATLNNREFGIVARETAETCWSEPN